MVKILRIINRFNIGGPVNNALYLSKYLDKKYETKLIGGIHTEGEMSASSMFDDQDVPYEIIPEMSRNISLLSDYKAYKKVSKIIQEYQPDIVHTHASKAGLIGRLAAFRYNVPVVVHTFHGHVFHSYFGKLKTQIFLNIERFLAKRTTKIIAISSLQKEELSSVYKIAPMSKFEVVPLGFNLEKFTEDQERKRKVFREKHYLKDDDVIISIIGRLVPIKNHHLFIEAIALLKDTCKKNIKAFIVGDGELKNKLIRQAKELGLSVGNKSESCDLNFTSWIVDMDYVYAGSDVIALTSKNEGTPVTLIEAQIALKPIVTTNVGGIKDVLVSSEFNIISKEIPSDFSEKLKQIILKLETGKQKLEIRQKTMGVFAFGKLVRNMEKIYMDCISFENA